MASISKMTAIEAQKQLLQAKNDVFRATLQLQLYHVQKPVWDLGQWATGNGRWPALFLLASAPFAAFLAVKKGWPIQRLLAQGLSAWQIVDKSGLIPLLRKRPPGR